MHVVFLFYLPSISLVCSHAHVHVCSVSLSTAQRPSSLSWHSSSPVSMTSGWQALTNSILALSSLRWWHLGHCSVHIITCEWRDVIHVSGHVRHRHYHQERKISPCCAWNMQAPIFMVGSQPPLAIPYQWHQKKGGLRFNLSSTYNTMRRTPCKVVNTHSNLGKGSTISWVMPYWLPWPADDPLTTETNKPVTTNQPFHTAIAQWRCSTRKRRHVGSCCNYSLLSTSRGYCLLSTLGTLVGTSGVRTWMSIFWSAICTLRYFMRWKALWDT